MMQPLKIMIVEDEPIIAQEVAMIVEDLGYHACAIVMHASEAAASFTKHEPDLLLMDINLGHGPDGISVAGKLMQLRRTPVVFVSSYADKATVEKAKALQPDGYVIKPFDERDLQVAIEMAFARYEKNSESSNNESEANTDNFLVNQQLFVRHKNRLVRLQPADIYYAEASSNYTIIVTATQAYTVSTHLAVVEKKLAPFGFIRVHRSYLVNLHQIEALEDDQLIIKDKSIPISRNARAELMQYITQL